MYLFVVVEGRGASVVEVVLVVPMDVEVVVVVDGGGSVVLMVVEGTGVVVVSGCLIPGAASRLKIGWGVWSAVSWGSTLPTAGRSNRNREHRAHMQPFQCLMVGLELGRRRTRET